MARLLKPTLIMVFLLGCGLWLAILGWTRVRTAELLKREGAVAEGKVIEHSASGYSRRSQSYRLTVEFTPANHPPLVRTFTVDGEAHRAAASGKAIVSYLPRDPTVCGVGSPAILPYQCLLALGCGMLALGLFCLWLGLARGGSRATQASGAGG